MNDEQTEKTPGVRFECSGVTIDSSFSRDLDDAIWVERDGAGWRITVSVADVCGGVCLGSPEDVAAYEAAFSRYAATRTVRPMLPFSLSEDRLTLLPGKSRDVMGVTLILSADLAVRDIRIAFGVLSHRGRLSHEQASALIDGGDPELHLMMACAWELASRLLHSRRTGGALAFFSSKSGLATNEEGGLVETGVYGPVSRAYIVVQELMILANRAVAEHFAREGTPLLYRNHRVNPLADRNALREDIEVTAEGAGPADAAARTRLGMLLGRATLGTKVTGHFGLNTPVYAWFTSPIRRYADLVNQRIVKAALLGEAPPYNPDALEHIAEGLNEAARLEAERRSAAFKEASERRAHRTVTRADFSGLGEADFQAVIKAVFAAGDNHATVPDSLGQEVLSRLATGQLVDKDAARVLCCAHVATTSLKTNLLRGLEEKTAMALTILNHMTQACGLGAPGWEETSSGPVHAPEFQCRARARLCGQQRVGTTVVADRRMEARQRAGLALLAEIAQARWQPPAEWLLRIQESKVIPLPKAADDNMKGKLQEMCQKRRWPMPAYEVMQSGPSHAPSFRAVAQVSVPQGAVLRSSEGAGGNRREAEHRAAANLIEEASGT